MDPRRYNLARLNLPVPPKFARICGYNGDERFISLYWTPYGDEVIFDDNYVSGTGEWMGFLMFLHRQTVQERLWAFDLGSSEFEARHALMLDRLTRTLYVGTLPEVRAFLQSVQPLEQTPELLSEAEFERAVQEAKEAFENMPQPDEDEIHRRLVERQEQLTELRAWLDQHL
jgi:hypothetical protein